MDLDDLALFSELDSQNIYQEIESLAYQLKMAWHTGLRCELPEWGSIRNICVVGMGTSALGAQLVSAYVEGYCPIPLFIVQDYHLPAWVDSPDTLLIAASYSGQTEEVLSAFREALNKACRCLAITTGGELAQLAAQNSVPVMLYKSPSVTGSAIGYAFALILAVIYRCGLIPDPDEQLNKSIAALYRLRKSLHKRVPAANNPAKRLAGQIVGQGVTMYAAGFLAPVARSWKIQINEMAKCGANVEILPEANHNALAGFAFPEEMSSKGFHLFLGSPNHHARNRLRSKLTRKFFMLQGLSTDSVKAFGDTVLENMWTLLSYGDYVAYYLAMAYGVDPASNEIFDQFNQEMGVMNL